MLFIFTTIVLSGFQVSTLLVSSDKQSVYTVVVLIEKYEILRENIMLYF